MAKDNTDNTTHDFIGLPAKRGRKPTGNALTAAERQRAYRARKAKEQKQVFMGDAIHAMASQQKELKEEAEKWRRIAGDKDLLWRKAYNAQADRIKHLEERCEALQKNNDLLLKRAALRR
jgi:hypothetical protein